MNNKLGDFYFNFSKLREAVKNYVCACDECENGIDHSLLYMVTLREEITKYGIKLAGYDYDSLRK